jgi:ubiquinone/menaquinone biosynthesis C-methylase UbiE
MKQEAVVQYQAIAAFYDSLMLHVNYRMWAQYIRTLLERFGKDNFRLIDLSCGTGSLLQNFQITKMQPFGNDLSPGMLQQARLKLSSRGIPLICSSFCSLPLRSDSFDAALVLYDSINYLLTEEDVEQFLSEAGRIIRPGGLLIFDVVTPYTCKVIFKDYSECNWDSDGRGYDRRSWYEADTRLQYNAFNIKFNGKYFYELHAQRILPINEWREFLDPLQWKIIGIFHNFTLNNGQEKSERVHFVCQNLKMTDQ